MKSQVLNLNHEYPRSPREKLGGIVHLGRITDKARSKGAGLLSDYLYPCPLDQALLEFLEVSADAFFKAVQSVSDAEVLGWIKSKGAQHSEEELEAWNTAFLNRKPLDDEGKRRFFRKRERIAPTRQDVVAWVDLLDLDEDRQVPIRERKAS